MIYIDDCLMVILDMKIIVEVFVYLIVVMFLECQATIPN